MELFNLVGKFVFDSADGEQAMEDTTEKAEKSGTKLGAVFNKFGGVAKKVGAVAVKAVGASAVAVGALTKASIDAYADYEQLVGGVETLFGAGGLSLKEYAKSVGKSVDDAKGDYDKLMTAQNRVLDDSKEAFKTCGMSANEYMETATSFSASLISSLGGDTVKASEKANQVMIQMSDNANKMGTDFEAISNAYNGFSKQNYTMLDNLKLGYGGTKTEMERLLSDAEKMPEALGRKFDIDNYADVCDAIKLVQDQMGITGTTAKEAESTISGSANMVKKSWENVLVGLASGNGDLDTYINDLLNSIGAFSNNVIPVVERILTSIGTTITEHTPDFINKIVELGSALLPQLLVTAVELVTSLVAYLPTLVTTLGQGLYSTLQSMFSETASSLEGEFGGDFLFIGETFSMIWDMMNSNWENIGKPIFDLIVECAGMTVEWFTSNFGSISGIARKVFGDIKTLWEGHLKPCFNAIGNLIKNVLAPAFKTVFQNIILPVVGTVFRGIAQFWDGTLKPVFTGIIDFITGVFSGDWETAFNGIIETATGILNGIEQVFRAPFDLAVTIVEGAINTIKGLFNFDWKLPELKLPHFKIKGGEPPFGFMGKGSLPSMDIEWYKDGGIMTNPTIFGFNPISSKLMAGGESGAEAIAPLDTLQSYIQESVSKENAQTNVLLTSILKVLTGFDADFVDNIKEGLANTSLNLNKREFARLVNTIC